MSAASVPLISTLNMSSTVVKSSLLDRSRFRSQIKSVPSSNTQDFLKNSRVTLDGTPQFLAKQNTTVTVKNAGQVLAAGESSSWIQEIQEIMCQYFNRSYFEANTYLLDCMSTVPLLMMSRSSTAHSVVCCVLRCTVSNMPPT